MEIKVPKKKLVAFASLAFLLITLMASLNLVKQRQNIKKNAAGNSTITLTIDTNSNVGKVKPIWRTTGTWKPWMWYNTAMNNGTSPGWFKNYFPFFDTIRLMAPLGGNINPSSCPICFVAETFKGDGNYDFSYIDNALDNVKKAGLYPAFELAQTPTLLRKNDDICDGFEWYSSTIAPDKVNQWKNFLNATIEHLVSRYGNDVLTNWNFASYNEADSGQPGGPNCSFSGTQSEYLTNVLLPTLNVLRSKNLLGNFHLGSFAGTNSPPRIEAAKPFSPEVDNDRIGSKIWYQNYFNALRADGFSANNFRSFTINEYGIYNPPDRDIFWIKDNLALTRSLIQENGFNMPIRSDELGLMYNYNSNTKLYQSSFAASWFAAVIKTYLDEGNIDQAAPWWYLLLKTPTPWDKSSTIWQRTLAYYTFLMYHQLSDNLRLSVTGGVFGTRIDPYGLGDRNLIVDAVAGKDNVGVIKALVINHDEELSGNSPDSSGANPNAPVVDLTPRNINVVFNNIVPGDYLVSINTVNDTNIINRGAELPVTEMRKITVPATGTYTAAINLPHHSVALLVIQPSFDQTITVDSPSSDAYFSWTTDRPTTSYIAYSDEPIGFDGPEPVNWGKWRFNIDNANAAAMKTDHPRIKIGGLIPGERYYYRVGGKDYPGSGTFIMQTEVKSFIAAAASTTPTPTPTPASSSVFRLNAGGPSYTDSNSNVWAADKAYTVGSFGYVGGGLYSTSTAISGTSDPTLYQTERYNISSYKFTIPNGNYDVTLKFAEIYPPNCVVNKRGFNIDIQGIRVLSDFDIFVKAGKICNGVIDQTFIASVTNGILTIGFTPVAGKDIQKINAIKIVSRGGSITGGGVLVCDFNGDRTVNMTDMSRLLSDYDPVNYVNSIITDVNGDHYVNSVDYSICVGQMGRSY